MASLSSKRFVSREDLARAITAAVKSQCEGFVGVLIERVRPQTRSGANWTTKGIKFGTADRDKSRKVLTQSLSTASFIWPIPIQPGGF